MTSILLTGASGVVGAALLHRLAGHRVTALTYRAEVPGRAVRGDVTRPWLGLHRSRYAELASSVDVVLHCAGVTDFTADDDTMRTQNVRGTEQIVRFAADAGARLVFSSTAFVARHELARPARTEEPGGTVDPRRYLASKLAAEEVVRRSGLPAAIARISVVIGDSAGGETSRFQGLHSTTSAIMRSLLPVLPFSPGATVDVLPRDLVAEALVALALPPTPSTGPAAEYWITAGAAAPTVQRLVDLVVARCGELGLPVSLPRFAPPAMVERVIRPVFIDPLPAKQRRRFANLMALASLFDGAGPFPTGLGTIPGGPPAPTAALIERAFVASVDYQARTEGLITAAQIPEQGGLEDGKPMVLKADPA
ncbi:SDR family oxidoreductase [Plantactinospora sp. ZYX-F-223]|uniref:SDR family oxidoreductase n=1 Tax=Plantactinospora sp. ZYX-F-223 TaxID=3144103 RepID=UPI0031FC97EA